jgi:hypothetical protein
VSDRIQRLQSLLERVKRNASAPRPRRRASAPPAPVSDTLLRRSQRAPASAPAPEPEEAMPMPLVRVASAPMAAPAPVPEPPPIIEAPSPTPFSMTTEVATVDFVESVPPAPAADVDVEDLSSDLLESLPPPDAWAGTATSTEVLVEEEPPISSQRPRIASGLEATLSESPGSEAPLMTPPPESGPQEAPPPQGMFAASVPNVDELLDESAGPISRAAPGGGPSPEQIGESVELGEPEGPSIELAEAVSSSASIPPNEELEALLDAPPSAGIYDEGLMPPPEARDELEAHARRFSPTGTTGDSVDVTPSMPGEASIPPALPNEVQVAPYVPPSAAEASGFAAPEVFSPAMPSGGAPEFRAPAPSFRPQSFLELLDASLALRG